MKLLKNYRHEYWDKCHLSFDHTLDHFQFVFSLFIDCSFVLCSAFRLLFDWFLPFSSLLVFFRVPVFLCRWILLKFLFLLWLIKKLFKQGKFLDMLSPLKTKTNSLITWSKILSPTVWYIPHISHRRRGRRPCKFFLPGVNFYRFNAKNWQFTV